MGLQLSDSVRVDASQTGHPVGPAPAFELVQTCQLGGVGRDDHLPAADARDAALLAVVIHLARSLHAQARLQRAGLVVDAGVDNAGVVAALRSEERRKGE